MAQRGIEPNERTTKALSRAAHMHGKNRTVDLLRLLEAGETNRAWELFDGLLERGHANEHHLTVMLKTCPSIDEQRALVQRAEEAGVATAVSTYTFLLGSARVEGRTEEAEALQQVMARRGIEPNEYTAKVLTLTLTLSLTLTLTLTLILTLTLTLALALALTLTLTPPRSWRGPPKCWPSSARPSWGGC